MSVENLSKGVGVHEFVRWDISVIACIKLYVSIDDQDSLRSNTDVTFTHFVSFCVWFVEEGRVYISQRLCKP